MPEETDAEIIDASLAEPFAFEAIFDRHFDAIYRYLSARIGRSLADDVAAETFTAAFAGRGRYDLERLDARPWLYGIATNLVRRHYRQEERRLRAYARGESGVAELGVEDIHDRVDAHAGRVAIAAALATLDARDRDALLLYASLDASYADVAEALGIPIGTVRSRLHRTRRLMRELLGSSGQYQDRDTTRSDLQEVLDG